MKDSLLASVHLPPVKMTFKKPEAARNSPTLISTVTLKGTREQETRKALKDNKIGVPNSAQ